MQKPNPNRLLSRFFLFWCMVLPAFAATAANLEYQQEWKPVATNFFTSVAATLRWTGLHVHGQDMAIVSHGNSSVYSWFSADDGVNWSARIALNTGWVYPGNWSVYRDEADGQIVHFTGFTAASPHSGKLGAWLWDGTSWESNSIALTGNVATYYHPWWAPLTNGNVGLVYKTDNSGGGGSATELRYVELAPMRSGNTITNFSVVAGTDVLIVSYFPGVCDIALDPTADYRPRIVMDGAAVGQNIRVAGIKADGSAQYVDLDTTRYFSARLAIGRDGTCYATCVSDNGAANFYLFTFQYDEQNNTLLNKVKLSQTDICPTPCPYYKSVIPLVDPNTDRPILTYTGTSSDDYWGYHNFPALLYVAWLDSKGSWREELLDDNVLIDLRSATAHALWNDIFAVAGGGGKTFVYLLYPKFGTGIGIVAKYSLGPPKGTFIIMH